MESVWVVYVLVAVAVVLDVVTGLVKAKSMGEGFYSDKAMKGFWKKMSLFVGLLCGIFLDYSVDTVPHQAGVNVNLELPYAFIIYVYIIINEAVLIFEN